MPVFWRVGLRGDFVVVVFSDPYTIKESERAMREIYARADLHRPLRILVDARASAPPDSTFVRTATVFWREHMNDMIGARLAVVVATPAQFGMARMTEIITEDMPFDVTVWRDWDDAEQWLRS
jgi:hypothetical protein